MYKLNTFGRHFSKAIGQKMDATVLSVSIRLSIEQERIVASTFSDESVHRLLPLKHILHSIRKQMLPLKHILHSIRKQKALLVTSLAASSVVSYILDNNFVSLSVRCLIAYPFFSRLWFASHLTEMSFCSWNRSSLSSCHLRNITVCCSWIFIRVKIGSKMEHVVFRSC